MTDSFNDLINMKKKLIEAILDTQPLEKNDNLGFFARIIRNTKMFTDLKMTLISLATILIAIGILVSPDIVLTVIKALAELILS